MSITTNRYGQPKQQDRTRRYSTTKNTPVLVDGDLLFRPSPGFSAWQVTVDRIGECGHLGIYSGTYNQHLHSVYAGQPFEAYIPVNPQGLHIQPMGMLQGWGDIYVMGVV